MGFFSLIVLANPIPSIFPGITTSLNTISMPSFSSSVSAAEALESPAHMVAELFEQAGACVATSGLSSTSRTVPLPFKTLRLPGVSCVGRFRQEHRDGGALAQHALEPDGPAGLVCEAVHLRQAETGAFADRLCREERIEHFRSDILRNSDAGIVDRYRDLSPVPERFSRG